MTTSETMTPAQVEQRALQAAPAVAVREGEFALAPAGMYPDAGEWAALKEMARALCITEFVPKDMRGRPYAVLGALLTGRDLGVPATAALRNIPVINGRPSLMTALKVALVRSKGHKVTVVEWTSESCTVRGWRKGDDLDEAQEVTYTIEDAKVAGDYEKGDTYKKRPRQMLYARAAGLLCDTYFTDVTLGLPDPDEVADMAPEVIEGRFVEADRRGQLPELPPEVPVTNEEHAAAEERRAEEAEARLAASPPPQPPRRTARGRGPKPNPQPGSDSGGQTEQSAAAPAGSPAAAGSPAPAGANADVPYTSPAQMARGLGLDEEAAALERGETLPDGLERMRRAEAAATAEGAPAAAQAAREAAQAEQGQPEPADDPFAAEPPDAGGPETVDISGLLRLRQKAEMYADFLTRKKLERDGKPPASVQALHEEALSRIEVVAKGILGHSYTEASEAELQDTLVPWLRQRYASEGGTEP